MEGVIAMLKNVEGAPTTTHCTSARRQPAASDGSSGSGISIASAVDACANSGAVGAQGPRRAVPASRGGHALSARSPPGTSTTPTAALSQAAPKKQTTVHVDVSLLKPQAKFKMGNGSRQIIKFETCI